MLGSHPMRVIYLVIFLIRKIIRIFSLIRIRNTGLMAVFLSRRASSEWWPPAAVYTRGPNIPHPAIPHQGTTMSPYVHTLPSINFEQFSTLVSFLLLKTKFNLKNKKNKTSCLVGFWIVLVTVILDFIVAKIIFVLKNHLLLTVAQIWLWFLSSAEKLVPLDHLLADAKFPEVDVLVRWVRI